MTTESTVLNEQEVNVDLAQQLEDALAQVNKLKALLKPKKEPKGDKVEFIDGEGNVIEGYGVLYYCVRHNGKLKYKEASQVNVIEKRL